MQALVKLSHFALAIRLVFSWKKLTVLSSIARRVDRGWGGGGEAPITALISIHIIAQYVLLTHLLDG